MLYFNWEVQYFYFKNKTSYDKRKCHKKFSNILYYKKFKVYTKNPILSLFLYFNISSVNLFITVSRSSSFAISIDFVESSTS